MTYPQGQAPIPSNLSARHRDELERARSYLESIAQRHPEWIVRKSRI